MNLMLMNLAATMAPSKWSINNLLTNLEGSLTAWGKLLITIIGIVMVVVGVVKIAQGMMSGGRGQVNWVLTIGLILIGGILAFSGSAWTLLENIGQGAHDTLDTLGTTPTILLGYFLG